MSEQDLIAFLRGQVADYKAQVNKLQFLVDDLEETNNGLRDDNMNLRAMVRSAYTKLFGPQSMEVAS